MRGRVFGDPSFWQSVREILMRTAMRLMGLALATAIVSGSGVRGDDEKDQLSGDLKQLQGTWVSTSENNEESRWVFEGKRVKSTVNTQDYISQVTLDPKATPHPTIDFKITEGPGESADKTSKGIYKLEGDKLTICVTAPGQGSRPTEFKRVEDEAYLFELKREKAKDQK